MANNLLILLLTKKSLDFFNSLTEKEKTKLHTWNSELYLERFRGCYTSQAKTKKHNRDGQVLIKTAEKLATIAGLFDHEYPRDQIFDVWRTLLFNQFHDVLPGTSINAVSHDTEREYAQSEKIAKLLTKRAFEVITKKIDTRGKGTALIIFNPLSWTRSSLVNLYLDDLEMDKEWTILDEYGNAIPVQKVDESSIDANLLFLAKDIPSFGYKVYRLIEGSTPVSSNFLKFSRSEIENENLRLKIDKVSGLITEIYDKVNARQVLAEPKGNLLQILKDDAIDAWNMRFSQPPTDLDFARKIKLEEFGPVRATIKVVHAFVGEKKAKPTEDFPSSFFTQYISLYDGVPYVEVRNKVSWWETHKVLKVGFPVNVFSKIARYEIPYCSIERPTGFETPFEKARYEVSAQRWADLSDGNYGVALINDCKHGYDIKGNVMRLTLLRGPTSPDPLADKGYHDFKYALYPHTGNFAKGQVVRRGLEFNEPLKVIRTGSHKGQLPKTYSFIQITPENVFLNALKKSEDDGDWILRIVETAGETAKVRVIFAGKISSMCEVNLIEDKINFIKSSSDQFSFRIKPFEIRSFKVHLEN